MSKRRQSNNIMQAIQRYFDNLNKMQQFKDYFLGCALQLQHWFCLPLLFGGSIYRHSLSHQLLFILSKTYIWLCIYIFFNWLSWDSGKFFCQWKINYSVLQYSDCFESCPTIWSICGSYSYNIPESYQYCLVLYLLLQTLHLSLCLQRLVGGPRYLHQLVCQE